MKRSRNLFVDGFVLGVFCGLMVYFAYVQSTKIFGRVHETISQIIGTGDYDIRIVARATGSQIEQSCNVDIYDRKNRNVGARFRLYLEDLNDSDRNFDCSGIKAVHVQQVPTRIFGEAGGAIILYVNGGFGAWAIYKGTDPESYYLHCKELKIDLSDIEKILINSKNQVELNYKNGKIRTPLKSRELFSVYSDQNLCFQKDDR